MTMSLSPSGVEYEEDEGSPKERMLTTGMAATRVFHVTDWTKRFTFAGDLIGRFGSVGVVPFFTAPMPYPGFKNLLVNELAIDPWMEDSPDGTVASGLPGPTNTYRGGARITANYRASFDTEGGGDNPDVPEGTTLVVAGQEGHEVYSTPGRVWRWGTVAGNPIVDPDTFPGLLIPTGDFTMTWGRVPLPPWDTIRAMRGKVNSLVFNRSPVGCLLFDGCSYRRMFEFLQNDTLWEITYSFREVVKTRADGSKVGWNYFYREQASAGEHWHSIQNTSGEAPYASADFRDLFKFATSVY